MFMVRFLRWLIGWVRFEAEGGFPERLLNLTAREDIELWSVHRQGVILRACCPVRHYRRLRSPARRAGMRMHVTERHGVPFFIRRYRSRAGLAVGLACFLAILQLFSQRTWVLEVRGNEKVSDEEILAVMKELGVREGADLSTLDMAALQLESLKKLPDLAWCAVNLNGSVAYIDVDERTPKPDLSNTDIPSNIKATVDGRIVWMETYTGQAVVKKGDAVAKGMLLVSGVVESKTGPILRRSQARILAETTRHIQVSVPLKETLILPSGRFILRPSFRLFTLDIPLYTDGDIEGQSRLTVSRHLLKTDRLTLPFGIINRRYELLDATDVVRTQQEAAELAKKRLGEKAASELSGAQIQTSKVNGAVQNGCYILTGEYFCIQDIGVEEPLSIGANGAVK